MLELHVLLVALLVGTQALFTGLAVLNVRHSERAISDRADWLRETLGLSDPDENAAYLRARTGLGQLSAWVTLGVVLLVVYSGLYRRAITAVAGLGLGPIAEGVVLFVGVVVFFQLLSVPFSLVSTFVIEEVFGFNEQTLGVWLRDQAIGLALSTVLTAVVAAGLVWAIDALGPWWPVAGVALVGAVSLAVNVAYPRFIMPLMYDFEPIEEGPLREAVEAVLADARFSPDGVYEVELSSHTSKSNAFFAGLGPTKRVGIADTLLERHDLPEVKSVLAHELGHYQLRHIWKGFAASLLVTGGLLAVAAVLLGQPWLTAMFGLGPTGSAPTYAALLTAGLWLWPVSRLAMPLSNRLSIRFEYQADAFAVETTGDPAAEIAALRQLADDNLANPFPHPWYETVHYDHPPIPKRVQAVQERFLDGPDDAGGPDRDTEGGTPAP